MRRARKDDQIGENEIVGEPGNIREEDCQRPEDNKDDACDFHVISSRSNSDQVSLSCPAMRLYRTVPY